MRSVFILTEKDFMNAVIDTRYDLKIVGITDITSPLRSKLEQLYGKREFVIQNNELTIQGDTSMFKPRYSFGDLLAVMSRLTGDDGMP